jgi:hypothetical protein
MIPATLKVYVNKSGVSNGAAEKSARQLIYFRGQQLPLIRHMLPMQE